MTWLFIVALFGHSLFSDLQVVLFTVVDASALFVLSGFKMFSFSLRVLFMAT